MSGVETLGFLAGAVTAFTFLPQVIKIWKEKSAKNVSLLMFIIAITNEIMWIVYGILLTPMNWVIIFTNSVLMVMALTIIFFKFKYK
ncbi:MAG: SemiSWEET family transporter [Chitinophagaceae bacterium]